MKIMVIDSNKESIIELSNIIREVITDSDIFTFTNGKSAVDFIKSNTIDVLFINLNISGKYNCTKVSQEVMKIRPKTNIIFCGDYQDTFKDLVSLHYSGFIHKPFTIENIQKEINDLRYPIGKIENKRIYFQCFGNFEVFINQVPLKFTSEKTKELLAYLVDRNGSMCRNKEIMAILWEDGKLHNSYLKKIKFELVNLLKENGCEDVLVIHHGSIGINKVNVDCDYYDWKRGGNDQLYQGEYMVQYSWAEYTINY